jgi:hypothetical protein
MSFTRLCRDRFHQRFGSRDRRDARNIRLKRGYPDRFSSKCEVLPSGKLMTSAGGGWQMGSTLSAISVFGNVKSI